MFKLINLTKFHVNVYPKDGEHVWIPPSGKVAAVEIKADVVDCINGIPVVQHQAYGNVYNLPDPEPDVYYIVDTKVLEAAAINDGRDDLLAIDDRSAAVVKSDVVIHGKLYKNKAIGVRGFQTIRDVEV